MLPASDSLDVSTSAGGASGGAGAVSHEDGPLADYRSFAESAVLPVLADSDHVRCVSIRPGFLVAGTSSGKIWRVSLDGKEPKLVGSHEGSVLHVAVDDSCAYVASSSADCTVAVSSLEECATSWTSTYAKTMLTLAICPTYASGALGSRVICVGGEEGKLILNRRGYFESRNTTVHSGEGAITSIRWRGTLVAWANAKGVKVVDVETYQKVTHIPRPSLSADEQSESSPASCCLTWSSADMLLVGWGSTVLVAMVRQKQGGPTSVRFASVLYSFRLPGHIVHGICVFDSEHLSVLSRDDGVHRGSTSTGRAGLELSVCTFTGEVACRDWLSIGSEGPNAHLVSIDNDSRSFIIASREFVAVHRRDIRDHLSWLVEHGQYEAAIALVSDSSSADAAAEKQSVCARCVAPLLAQGALDRAAGIVRQFNASDVEIWRQVVSLFDDAGALPQLWPEMPAPPDGELPPEIYDSVLRRLAVVSPSALRAALGRWPAHLFSAGPLAESLQAALPGSFAEADDEPHAEERLLAEALAEVHEVQGDFAAAAKLLVRLGSTSIFSLLERHLGEDRAMRESISKDLSRLFDLSPWEALALFVGHTAAFPPEEVVTALTPFGHWWQLHYLRLLLRRDPDAALAQRSTLTELVAELEPHNLQPLLKRLMGAGSKVTIEHGGDACDDDSADEDALGQGVESDAALAMCRACRAHDAEAMLLARRGQSREALDVLLDRLGDIGGALRLIARAPAVEAPDLWKVLQDLALTDARSLALLAAYLPMMSRPPTVVGASQAGLIRLIPNGLEVPRLGPLLEEALADAEAERDLQAISLRDLETSTQRLSQRLFKTQRRGRAVNAKAAQDGGMPKKLSERWGPANTQMPMHRLASGWLERQSTQAREHLERSAAAVVDTRERVVDMRERLERTAGSVVGTLLTTL